MLQGNADEAEHVSIVINQSFELMKTMSYFVLNHFNISFPLSLERLYTCNVYYLLLAPRIAIVLKNIPTLHSSGPGSE